MKLPSKLGKEPLVDALFEVRFKSRMPASSLLPGILFSGLAGDKSLERLPASNLPDQIRNNDPNLIYAPLVRIAWGKAFGLLVGDRGLAVACQLPYPGWGVFKPSIIEVMNLLGSSQIVEAVERCSIKMTNVMPTELGRAKDIIDSEMKISKYNILESNFQVNVEIKEASLLHLVRLASEATAITEDGRKSTGMLFETDTIMDLKSPSMEEFLNKLTHHLELLHDQNKQVFFSCVRQDTLKKLEPRYD